ncbi:MAG: DsrE family protein [Candidatus Sulfobium sp.]|jgi:tRNA 2-thiouridine synthesizing protein D
MEKIAMILRKPPYGDTNAAEAVRHAVGAVSGNISPTLILVDGGVELARQGQDASDTGFTDLADTLRDCVEMGIEVLADNVSVMEQGLKEEDILEGVKVVDESQIAAVLKQADASMIF